MLRKMVFGSRGRLSTDLDFTRRSDISVDDLTTLMLDVLAEPYHGISFRFDRDGDWYLTDDGCAANPFCSHQENQLGIKVKLQVSTRESPILPVVLAQQIEEDYFRLLPFEVAPTPSLALEEAVAEKIRAGSQRSKIRDLHDLAEISRRPINRDLIRTLAVLKLWNSGGPGLNFERFRERVRDRRNYDIADLEHLLRRDQNPDLEAMIRQVVEGFRFLEELTELEQVQASFMANYPNHFLMSSRDFLFLWVIKRPTATMTTIAIPRASNKINIYVRPKFICSRGFLCCFRPDEVFQPVANLITNSPKD